MYNRDAVWKLGPGPIATWLPLGTSAGFSRVPQNIVLKPLAWMLLSYDVPRAERERSPPKASPCFACAEWVGGSQVDTAAAIGGSCVSMIHSSLCLRPLFTFVAFLSG